MKYFELSADLFQFAWLRKGVCCSTICFNRRYREISDILVEIVGRNLILYDFIYICCYILLQNYIIFYTMKLRAQNRDKWFNEHAKLGSLFI